MRKGSGKGSFQYRLLIHSSLAIGFKIIQVSSTARAAGHRHLPFLQPSVGEGEGRTKEEEGQKEFDKI